MNALANRIFEYFSQWWASYSIASMRLSISAGRRLWPWAEGIQSLRWFWRPRSLQWAFYFLTHNMFEDCALAHIFGLLRCVREKSENDMISGSRTPFLSAFTVSALGCVKRNLTMIDFTCCLINPATGGMKNALETARLMTAFINVSDSDSRSKHCNMTSSAASPLKISIAVVSKYRADAVYILFDAALLFNLSMLTRVSRFLIGLQLECCSR